MVHADVIIATGGIGPTADDLTTELVAKVAGVGLTFSEEVAENIRRIFASLNRTMPENNLKQAQFPAGATIIPNHLGTAPGYRLELDTPQGRKLSDCPAGCPARDETYDGRKRHALD